MNKKDIAKLLVQYDCLVLSPSKPFSYASGLKGPIYCDNRKILSYPDARKQVADQFTDIIRKSELSFKSLAGLATGGLPHCALVAERLDVPMIYIRSSAKKHGKGNQVEGFYESGDEVLLIEDLVNQGSSLEEAVVGAKEAGLVIKGCISIVDYQMPAAKERLEKFKIPLFSLTNFESILEMGISAQKINDREVQVLRKWQKNPESWF